MELPVDNIFNWFEYNNLIANAPKCHFSLLSYQHTSININGPVIKISNSEKLLWITITMINNTMAYHDFTFEEHI